MKVPLIPALVAGVVLFGLGVVLGRARRAAPERQDRPTTVPAAPAPATTPESVLGVQRRALVDACIEVRDLVPSTALRSRLGRALSAAGVSEIDPSGSRFDPTLHRAIEAVETDEASLENVVASVERIGYVDDGRSLRLPEVVVYRLRRP